MCIRDSSKDGGGQPAEAAQNGAPAAKAAKKDEMTKEELLT